MTTMQIMFIFALIIGIIFIVASFFMRKEVHENGLSAAEGQQLGELAETMIRSIAEAENRIEEMHVVSQNILDELEGKYQDLLFLYQLIDEKKKEAEQLFQRTVQPLPEVSQAEDADIEEILTGLYESQKQETETAEPAKERIKDHLKPKLEAIQNCFDEGLTMAETARKLEMGQDEIKFILELNQSR